MTELSRMEFPGEKLLIRLWETIAEKGIGGWLRPWQNRREGQSRIDAEDRTMARPRLGDEERRVRTVGVRVTEAEAEELRERAQAARLSVGAYLRRRGLGQRVRVASERRLGRRSCGS